MVEELEQRQLMAASVGWDGPGRGAAQLSYYLGGTQGELSTADFKAAIDTALQAWSSAAAVTFTQVSNPGLENSLDITFKSIDGSGGVLAQAYFPKDVNRSRIAGDVQFDTGENWEIGNARGNAAFDLVLVAVHEIGHALGLDHSYVLNSVMADSVSPASVFTSLSSTDVNSIRQLYAPANTSSVGTNPPPTPAPPTNSSPSTPPVNTPTISFVPRFWWRVFNRFGFFGVGWQRAAANDTSESQSCALGHIPNSGSDAHLPDSILSRLSNRWR